MNTGPTNTSNLPLHLQAKQYLLNQIKRLQPGRNKLEPENALSEKLGMSRETVRKAMTSLIQEGVITRWHGKGNFGHPAVSNLPMRIDLNSDFRRLIASTGRSVRSIRSDVQVRTASERMIARMPEAAGKDIVAFTLRIYADDELAIQGDVELLKELVVRLPSEGEYTENMDVFLKGHCTTESNHITAWLMAEHNDAVARSFGEESGAPLLCWEEIYYNLFDEKMGYVRIHFNTRIMDLSMMLKF